MELQSNPFAVLQTDFSVSSSRVSLNTVEVGLFTILASRLLTAAELVAESHLRSRFLADFLEVLVSVRMLVRDNEGSRVGNSRAS